ncbi:hypothetical protein [Microcoleus sp. herbarium14]|uniref:hypothetical protein n=1 Tax=Microcoleus sp. herbarium14 TaxID=3055439 RepID=UPI002FD0C9C6
MHNTFTYRHSELPPLRPAIKAEIVALDVQIADLILRSQGNYRELEELIDVLDSGGDSCELNLNSIRIIPDDSQLDSPISMMDLPIEQKQIVFSTALTSSIAIEALAAIYQETPQQIAIELSELVKRASETITSGQVNAVIKELLEDWGKKPNHTVYRIELD